MGALRYHPDPGLYETCSPVVDFFDNGELENAIRCMSQLLQDAKCPGISGPQIGYMHNVVLINSSILGGRNSSHLMLLNPRITWRSIETTHGLTESCLSIPNVIASIERPVSIEVEYLARTGEKIRVKHDGWPARIIQHEIDHLVGRLMFDRMDRNTKEILLGCC